MKLQERTVKGSKIRKDGLTPGVLYGKGMDSVSVQVETKEFQKMYYQYGTTKTFEITLNKKKHLVYIKETQSSFVNHSIKTHFDIVKVAKGDTMTSKVNVVFVNREEVEKRGLLVLDVNSSIDVEYPVGSGISHLELDVAGLNDHDTLKVSDIKVPEDVTILTDMDSVVVSISSPREEVEEPEGDTEVITEVESIKQKSDNE